MRLDRFEDGSGLSQYSYAVVCEGAAMAAIVDPRRDVDVYLRWAEDEGIEIVHVLETHVHADFCSGARELAERTGAALWESAYDAGETYEVAFEHRELADGDEIELGAVRIRALHTPGHTPEHLSFLVFDGNRAEDVPEMMLSGDFLFVGSLGRPDLLGEGAKRELAARLFGSVREVLADLPDGLEVHPGHGAGSMCGSGMSGRPMSTLGFERRANPYLDPELTEAAFIEKILGATPPFPPYYLRMKRVNAAGPAILNGLPGLDPMPVEEFARGVQAGHAVVDLRDFLAFGAGHVPGAFGIGVGGSLSAWAAWVVPYDTPILLVAPDPRAVELASRALVRVGLDDVAGWLQGGIETWIESGREIATLPQMDATDLHERLDRGAGPAVLDVRSDDEWANGHIEGALHIHGGQVQDRIDEIPRNRGVVVLCGSGYRSTVAASVLQRAGFEDVRNVPGGMGAWARLGLPLVRD